MHNSSREWVEYVHVLYSWQIGNHFSAEAWVSKLTVDTNGCLV